MHTVIDMARHYGVFTSTIYHHIKRGNLPHPKDLPTEKTIEEALSIHPYPGQASQPKGPGIRGGKQNRLYGKDCKHIATGPPGIGKLARHFNTTAAIILTLISQGKLPDPRRKAINLNTLPDWPKDCATETPHDKVEPQSEPWFDKKKTDTGLIQRMANLEAKMDTIIRHLVTMRDQIGGPNT